MTTMYEGLILAMTIRANDRQIDAMDLLNHTRDLDWDVTWDSRITRRQDGDLVRIESSDAPRTDVYCNDIEEGMRDAVLLHAQKVLHGTGYYGPGRGESFVGGPRLTQQVLPATPPAI